MNNAGDKPVEAMAMNTNTKLVDVVKNKVDTLVTEGALHFPPNYSASNALYEAWLIIQDTKDKNGNSVLDVCTGASVVNAMLNTVIQGLSPKKRQIYYIPYGNQLQALRSYFGTIAVTKRLPGVKDVYAVIVYEKDVFEAHLEKDSWKIDKHESRIENADPDAIKAAYAVIEKEDGSQYIEIMNKKQIDASWNKSKTSKTVHKEFPDQMAKRTVINRACKMFANTSDDSDLLIGAFVDTGEPYDNTEVTVNRARDDKRLSALNAALLDNVLDESEDDA